MSVVGYDGQSFLIGSRRVWLVGGAVHYSRVPAGLWRSRVQAARQAGLNCIDCYVVWNLHERLPGEFDFSGDLDLRRFVQTVIDEGMYCVLKPGPYVGLGYDMGGLPAWLLETKDIGLRERNGPFLEATARYLGAVLDQVKGLQVPELAQRDANDPDPTAGPRGIVMMQVENGWSCDHPKEAKAYLGELVRYLREHGCAVPICETSNLWSSIEGAIACWQGHNRLPGILRQLRVVQDECPRILIESGCGPGDLWGHESDVASDPERWGGDYLSALASVLAVGGQYSLETFHGGTRLGFSGGRLSGETPGFVATGFGHQSPLGEAGARGDRYQAVKLISTFASQFGHVLAHLEPAYQPACIVPTPGDPAHGSSVSVVHQRGSQGDVVFLFDASGVSKPSHSRGGPNASGRGADRSVELLAPSGVRLAVPMGDDPVAWVVLGAQLSGVASLTYTNLRPWAFLGRKMLVLFGPAGADGIVCINEAVQKIAVPTGPKPAVEHHEGLTVVVLARQQMNGAYAASDRLVLGVDGFDEDEQPIRIGGDGGPVWTVHPDGTVEQTRARKLPRRADGPVIAGWKRAGSDSLLAGENEKYQAIDGPRSLELMGCYRGYGWYRISEGAKGRAGSGKKNRRSQSKKYSVMAVGCGDRLHFYNHGRLQQVVGEGPGARAWPVSLSLGPETVVLADNLGRWSDGWQVGQPTGLGGHLYAVEPVRLPKPKVTETPWPDLFAQRAFVPFAHWGDRAACDALTWNVRLTGQNPWIIEAGGVEGRAAVLVNGVFVGAYDSVQCGGGAVRWLVEVDGQLKRGTNEIQLIVAGPRDTAGSAKTRQRAVVGRWLKGLKIHRVTQVLTAKSQWAFAHWDVPGPGSEGFTPLPAKTAAGPCWYRTTFHVDRPEIPLWLEPHGMTKGQIFINGHNAGRYFVATDQGQRVGPQTRYYLPGPWLKLDQVNELLLFDEHGASPLKCRLVHDGSASTP